MDRVFEIDVGATGSVQQIDGLAGYIGLQVLVAPMSPMKPMILYIDLQDPLDHIDPYPVADVKIGGADSHGFFATLTEIEIDPAGDLDAMKTLGGTFLGVLVID